MSNKGECVQLSGFARVLDTAPGFLLPLFRAYNHAVPSTAAPAPRRGGGSRWDSIETGLKTFIARLLNAGDADEAEASASSNSKQTCTDLRHQRLKDGLLAQITASDHTILGFQDIDLAGATFIPSSEPSLMRTGAQCFVAYELHDGEVIVGTHQDIKVILGEHLGSPVFDDKPYSQWELCRFCNRTDLFPLIAKRLKAQSNTHCIRSYSYFVANFLAKEWIDNSLGTGALGGRTEHLDYALFLQDGSLSFRVRETMDLLTRESIGHYVSAFNALTTADTDKGTVPTPSERRVTVSGMSPAVSPRYGSITGGVAVAQMFAQAGPYWPPSGKGRRGMGLSSATLWFLKMDNSKLESIRESGEKACAA